LGGLIPLLACLHRAQFPAKFYPASARQMGVTLPPAATGLAQYAAQSSMSLPPLINRSPRPSGRSAFLGRGQQMQLVAAQR
jgi:hypothetical protein